MSGDAAGTAQEREPEELVSVTVVSGFLGSGKTTLLQRVIHDPVVGPDVAVLVNELGTLGLDGELLGAAQQGLHVATVELASGCLCCALKGAVADAIAELARPVGRRPPRYILVETSGAALASEVRFQLGVVALNGAIRCEGVVTLVDAVHAERADSEATEVFADQLRAADLVLLNKIDLVAPDSIEERLAALRIRAPRATCLAVSSATVDVRLLLGALPLAAGAPVAPGAAEVPTHIASAHGLRSLSLQLSSPLELEPLEEWLEELSGRIFRIKGVVDTSDGPRLVQAVGDSVELTPLPRELATAQRRLVLIAARLDPEALEAELAALPRAASLGAPAALHQSL